IYTASSRLTLPFSEGKSQQPFSCQATHPQGTSVVEVSNPGGHAPSTTVVTLHPPSRDDFEGPYRNSSILCQIRGRRPSPGAVQWLKDGAPLKDGITTEGLVADGKGAYVTNSRVAVTEAEWNAGTVYTCRVDDELRNTSKALECG
ncbi:IGHM protein, partial [Scopus umbretta]|nr:IGHM protein [Scopus umbretta]